MEFLSAPAVYAIAACALLLLGAVALRVRRRRQRRREAARDALDTVADWQPVAARVLTIDERQAYDLLKRAMPGFLVLAQVPLARFVRVPTRHSYAEWLQRAGSISADLLLCDSGSKVLAVIDIRPEQESQRARRRHERMARVLRAAGIPVHTWREGDLPGVGEARHALAALAGPAAAGLKAPTSRPMPLIPVPDIAEVLAHGDRAAMQAALDQANEPVPSAFFEELETASAHS
ncbi:MAG: DUF2726 domain-containing protein [Burkholderiales bacterium]|nr:DUF2726 domain-containing protein [Burkholderiales bacterium]